MRSPLIIFFHILLLSILFSEPLKIKVVFNRHYGEICAFLKSECSEILDELENRMIHDLNELGKREKLSFLTTLSGQPYTSFQITMRMENLNEILLSAYQYKENLGFLRFVKSDEKRFDKLKDFESSLMERIALIRLKFGDYDGYLRLTYRSSVDEYPWFSKDRRFMCFISDRGTGNRDLHILDLENFGILRLTTTKSSEYFPRFSPDGKTVIFQSTKTGRWSIWMVDLDRFEGSYLKSLNPDGKGNLYTPFWDESGIYFSMEKNGEYGIYLFKDGILEKLFSRNVEMFSPFHFDNGILFTMVKPKGDTGIFLLKDGKAIPFEDTPFNEFDPIISEDGRWFAFVSNREGKFFLWLRSMITGKLYEIPPPSDGDIFYPSFMNDENIAFTFYPTGKEPDIWIYNFRSIIEMDGKFEKFLRVLENLKSLFNEEAMK
ncbi:MAG: hypothetical protein DRP30_03770 [Thermotoga sp.]|nr:MAG: hypothetical protein DRP30_03770 [Thermotoga sp.]